MVLMSATLKNLNSACTWPVQSCKRSTSTPAGSMHSKPLTRKLYHANYTRMCLTGFSCLQLSQCSPVDRGVNGTSGNGNQHKHEGEQDCDDAAQRNGVLQARGAMSQGLCTSEQLMHVNGDAWSAATGTCCLHGHTNQTASMQPPMAHTTSHLEDVARLLRLAAPVPASYRVIRRAVSSSKPSSTVGMHRNPALILTPRAPPHE